MATDENLQTITKHPAPACKGFTLKPVTNKTGEFNCDGCIQTGAGTRYELSLTDSVRSFHICCAVIQPELNGLKFVSDPPQRSDGGRRLCAGAGGTCRHAGKNGQSQAANLFVYYDSGSESYYHPCCANESCKCTKPPGNSVVTAVRKHGNPKLPKAA